MESNLRIFKVQTRGAGLYEFTGEVTEFVRSAAGEAARGADGTLSLFVRHTSCSLVIQENADPDVQRDLQAFYRHLVPHSDDPSMGWITHRMEGPDDMAAHIKASMLPVSLTIPVFGGRMALGTWQGIYLFEHRDRPHAREVAAKFMPDQGVG